MPKVHINLSLDKDIYDIAINSGLNLSQEFEEWIKIRMNQTEENNNEDVDLLIAKTQAELSRLQSRKEIVKTEVQKAKEEVMIIDDMIEDMKKFEETEVSDMRIHGIQFLFKKKFNKTLNPLEAKELIENRISERNLTSS